MDGFTFIIMLFLIFVILIITVICNVKGNMAVYLTAITATLSAWFLGLLLDANIDAGDAGFLSFRILLPILAMGLCILRAIMKNKRD